MKIKLEKKYDAGVIEKKGRRFWEENELFRAGLQKDKKPFCTVIPPPGIT